MKLSLNKFEYEKNLFMKKLVLLSSEETKKSAKVIAGSNLYWQKSKLKITCSQNTSCSLLKVPNLKKLSFRYQRLDKNVYVYAISVSSIQPIIHIYIKLY